LIVLKPGNRQDDDDTFIAGVCDLCGLVVTDDDPQPCDGIGCEELQLEVREFGYGPWPGVNTPFTLLTPAPSAGRVSYMTDRFSAYRLSTEPGDAPVVGVRLPRELRDRVLELAGDGKGALSAFIREAVAGAVEARDREAEQ